MRNVAFNVTQGYAIRIVLKKVGVLKIFRESCENFRESFEKIRESFGNFRGSFGKYGGAVAPTSPNNRTQSVTLRSLQTRTTQRFVLKFN